MAITRQKKEAVVTKVSDLMSSAKLTVLANYSGLSVADMQALRRQGKEALVTLVVAKNRLVKLALGQNPTYKKTDTAVLTGQLALAIGEDEVAPAQLLANFAKNHPSLEIVAGIGGDGKLLDAAEVKTLAELPSKDVLRGQLVGVIAAPLSGFVNVLSGNLRGLVNVLNARAEAIK